MNTDDILRVIGECTRRVLPGLATRAIERSDRLADLGATSMDRAEILMMTLETLSLRIARTELAGPRNLGELADLLHERLSADARG